MNPWLLIGGAAAALYLFTRKSEPAQGGLSVKVPTSSGTATVKVSIPSAKPTATKTTSSTPAPDSQYLTDYETGLLIDGSADDIYEAAMASYYKVFIAAAAARLAAMGDPRSVELAAHAAESES